MRVNRFSANNKDASLRRKNTKYFLSILGKKKPYFKEKCVFVLSLTEMRIKLFLIMEKSEAHVLKKVVFFFKVCILEKMLARLEKINSQAPLGKRNTNQRNSSG